MSDSKEAKKDQLSFYVEISTYKAIMQAVTFKTKVSAPNLESAFLDAINKTKKMKEADPQGEYVITEVRLRD